MERIHRKGRIALTDLSLLARRFGVPTEAIVRVVADLFAMDDEMVAFLDLMLFQEAAREPLEYMHLNCRRRSARKDYVRCRWG
jgi:hypothetical protein